ncbi:DUF2461 domain-containing protein [Phaeobacter gallaeciensis]|uniref:DUF2461 domain-containing protein n=1 Tax=Phaeobacter gallaeciensis TaxID=60890 RepID=A0ABD4XFW0_9RHOB|nr:DUF2461 domain-containing protein [Phaeobacter gallaeciensis]MDE4147117.1 DUF2461 domain-containing protein [Phaeobacter gallaeciensis]MDE4159758.1 DUF2461 domain-containing protein [Phaeobacter gallaeciensis]MDE4163976.1 DUF2461 domain-containing protein [Phaeobacter gallaeciensis]MDE4168211.1 DUF2461 domain-containing protein [Phaeobacter gallaeciensis]MDE4172432.1 DUF2461 domain-containing protein [Phaeobacter gallaeciensis]
MSDGFTQMIDTSRTFLGALALNNDRDWFEAHKKAFKSEVEAPLKLLTDLFAEDISLATGKSHTGKVGRIYRDVRFSKDKSPYNTHVHAYWMQANSARPGWLLHIDAGGAKIMTGLHALDADGLMQYRKAVDRDGDALKEAIGVAADKGARLVHFAETTLKRVPRPFDKDHPYGDLLRRKQIVMEVVIDLANPDIGFVAVFHERVADLLPFWTWCDNAFG